jgi:hypothetical protein
LAVVTEASDLSGLRNICKNVSRSIVDGSADRSHLQKILDTMMGIHAPRRRGCDLFRIPGPGSPGQCHGLKSHIDAKVMNNNAGQLLD